MRHTLRTAMILVLSLVGMTAQAQFSKNGGNKKDFKEFLNSKTHVVLDTDEVYNAAIKKTVESAWNITPFDFITTAQFNTMWKQKGESFIMWRSYKHSATSNYGGPGGGYTGITSTGTYIACFMGDNSIKPKPNGLAEDEIYLAYVPLDIEEDTMSNCVWRMPMIIHSMHNALMLNKTVFADKKMLLEYNYAKEFEKRLLDIVPNKTLWIIKDDFFEERSTKDKKRALKISEVSKYYRYSYRIVSKEEAQKAMEQQMPGVTIFMPIHHHSATYSMIYDVEEKNIVYLNTFPSRHYLTPYDFECITGTIQSEQKEQQNKK